MSKSRSLGPASSPVSLVSPTGVCPRHAGAWWFSGSPLCCALAGSESKPVPPLGGSCQWQHRLVGQAGPAAVPGLIYVAAPARLTFLTAGSWERHSTGIQGRRHDEDKEDGEPKTKQLREGEEEEEEGEKHRELRLRNYVPEDEALKKRRVPQAKPVAVEEKVKEQLEAAKPEPIIEEVDLANLAPRKPDWDLKRDVAKKLEKLEKRTQRAIAELIRERLRGQEDSLASAVEATTGQEACDSD
ncbi:coiled-coil domain-containing protein 12 isoform 1-T1 [Glossophaga mutica]